ncbi:uncharacterized protein EAF01_011069 [Botrytis porri]|uniref:VOC domain-containing protein n=1 Tax=Botrytis porri TaxID=87229 RepID=A0A4Z1KQ73_9HELO|nr:uncharacterized protein EAF01_011069 [Botrytis porri]KAF7887915.1 hypothetical protein EAF01_011069 [Botrytis porri]TGO87706.1 hypothetical protein BPOR_0209g00140 [Botrytis porri]
MTINHIFFNASAAKFQALRAFCEVVLKPIGYTEMVCTNNDGLIGYGSDYPYFWLKKLAEGQAPMPTHVAFDAPSREAVDRFYEIALQNGGCDNGPPGIRKEMSRQLYYAAFVSDIDGNNLEAVYISK